MGKLILLLITSLMSFGQITKFESELPIIIIDTENQTILNEERIVCNMGIIYNEGEINNTENEYNEYNGNISIEIRGSSSQFFEKKSYSIETQKINGDNNNVSLLGLPKENDWILYGPYYDKTLIRNTLTYKLFENMGHYSPRYRYCELFINDDYKGIYVFIEKIKQDKNRIDILEVDNNNISGGYIFKIDHLNIAGNSVTQNEYWNSNYLSVGGDSIYFQYYYPKHDEITTEQIDYLQDFIFEFETILNTNSFNNGEVGLHNWIDFSSAIDFFIIQELSKNIDAYRASTYVYKDNNIVSEKLFFGPVWDFNFAYGSTSFCEGDSFIGWQNESSCGQENPNWFTIFLQDSTYKNQLNCRWVELRNGVLSMDSIFNLMDSLNQTINEASERNNVRWGMSQELVYQSFFSLEEWIIKRLNWLDDNMFGYCENIITSSNYKSLWKIVDVLGKETTNKGFQLHIYDDGSVEKKYVIE